MKDMLITNRMAHSFVTGEILEAAWKSETGWPWNAQMRSWTLDWYIRMFIFAKRHSS